MESRLRAGWIRLAVGFLAAALSGPSVSGEGAGNVTATRWRGAPLKQPSTLDPIIEEIEASSLPLEELRRQVGKIFTRVRTELSRDLVVGPVVITPPGRYSRRHRLGMERRHPGGNRTTAGRPVHLEGFLQGPRAVE